MIEALSTPQNKILTLIFLAICALLAIVAVTVGIEDNLPGILLAFLASTSFILAFVHPWRISKPFMRLLFASLLGLAALILFSVLAEKFISSSTPSILEDILNTLSIIAFMVFPSGILVGLIGAIIMFSRNRKAKNK